ncbi:hypothetical protein [Chromobacterium sp. MWU14-2602]|uniref:Uncharacterized protein n=1 Tax=Chromobacterium alticapitis TaxID=2073169 RepID=A0A2S5DEG8_9NEIS|nr:hypothetical protein C2I19_14055 [Chromobacterium alticapitis]
MHRQAPVSNELRRRSVFVSPSGVHSVVLRHDLASFKQRLHALERVIAEWFITLTNEQIAVLGEQINFSKMFTHISPP